jgi:hypothetical protein
MQSFDAKRINPSPATAKPRKLGVGTGRRRRNRDTLPLSSQSPPRATPALGRPSLVLGGCKGRRGRGAQGPPQNNRVLERREQTHFWFSFEQLRLRSKIRVLLGLSHTVLPVMRGGKRRGEKGNRSFLPGLRRPGRAQPRSGAVGSAPAGERTLAPSFAPARPAPPAPSFLVGSRKAQQPPDVCRASRNLC